MTGHMPIQMLASHIASSCAIAVGSHPLCELGSVLSNRNLCFPFVGYNGFILPANEIIPNSQEVIDGIIAMVDEARKLRYL